MLEKAADERGSSDGRRRRARNGVRAVVQRVSRASVTVAGEVVGEIGPGLLALVGVTHDDGPVQAAALARKIHGLRVLRGERSLADSPDAGVLVVSQFTLYGDVRKGRRPTWLAAAPGAVAEPLVEAVVADLRALGATVATGVFGADMGVALVNDGPITLVIDV
jgi:D-tyrosyl-tRNA(Tyr) deacylase